jgi:hypothetical protein
MKMTALISLAGLAMIGAAPAANACWDGDREYRSTRAHGYTYSSPRAYGYGPAYYYDDDYYAYGYGPSVGVNIYGDRDRRRHRSHRVSYRGDGQRDVNRGDGPRARMNGTRRGSEPRMGGGGRSGDGLGRSMNGGSGRGPGGGPGGSNR